MLQINYDKPFSEFTREELEQMDGGTIADLIHDAKRRGEVVEWSLRDSMMAYQERTRIDRWD